MPDTKGHILVGFPLYTKSRIDNPQRKKNRLVAAKVGGVGRGGTGSD